MDTNVGSSVYSLQLIYVWGEENGPMELKVHLMTPL